MSISNPTPSQVRRHPSILAVRQPECDFTVSTRAVDASSGAAGRPLAPPLPPRDGIAWQLRRNALARHCAEAARHVQDLPLGWFGAVELLVHALDARGLGASIKVLQWKENFGTARLYTRAPEAAAPIVRWCQELTNHVCAYDGTADVELVRVGGCYLNLSSARRAELQAVGASAFRDRYTCHPAWARDDARFRR